jgi:hypothetical protein
VPSDVLPAMVTVEKMFFDYKVRGGDEHIRPVRKEIADVHCVEKICRGKAQGEGLAHGL